MARSLLMAMALLGTVVVSGAWAAEQGVGTATVVAAGGIIYQGQVKSLDEKVLTLVTTSGKTVTLERRELLLINFQPDWLAVKACGAQNGTFYDVGAAYSLPLPGEGWTTSQDAEGHLFLHRGKFTLAVYAYLSRYSTLNVFLSVHAHWRETQKMPRESYVGGVEMRVDGLPAQAFTFETTVQGKPARVLDIKTVGPGGNGYVITLMGTDVSDEEFEAGKRDAMSIIGKFHFLRVQS